ncbi:MAG: DUF342 domain-containing protein [Eubacteriales bacterium]
MQNNEKMVYEPIKFNLILSKDKLSAYVRAEKYEDIPEDEREFDTKVIYDLAKDYGVKYGIDDEAVKEFARGKRLYQDLELAHGKAPVDGIDGKVRYLFDVNVTNAPKENEDGTVDYKELGLIQNVTENELLCKITLPTMGTKGINVLGEDVLPKDGKPVELNLGQGVELSKDGLEVRATMDGRVVSNRGTIEVSNVYAVKGDVGPETGNIRFNGSVTVQGNVMSDYSIFAKGDIVVNGYVEASMLNASGNIIIANGVNGMKKGLIKADGSITTKFAEMARLIAGTDIFCDYSINSDFRANRDIVASGKKGSLLGGSYLAGNAIEAKMIGSEINVSMDLQIVPDWMHEIGFTLHPEERIVNYKKAGQEFAQDLADCEKGAIKMEKNLLQISQRLQKDVSKEEMRELKQKVLTYNQERTRLKEAIEEIKEKQKMLEADLLCIGCKIVAKDIIHTGVRIVMGTQTYRINGHEKTKTYVLEDGEIKSYGITTGA